MSRFLAPVFGLALATVLFALSFGPTIAGFVEAPGNSATRLLFEGYGLSEEGYQRAFESRRRALRWHWTGARLVELGAMHHQTAGREDIGLADVHNHLGHAEGLLKGGLALWPVERLAWLRLAYLELGLDRPWRAMSALAMSYRSSPWSPELGRKRIELALALWVLLPEGIRRAASLDIAARLRSADAEWMAGTLLRLDIVDEVQEHLTAVAPADVERLETALSRLLGTPTGGASG